MKGKQAKSPELTVMKPQKVYVEANERSLLQSHWSQFGKKKKLPRGLELQALIALSHYPELCDVEIEFRYVRSNQPLAAQPVPTTFFRKSGKRAYVVKISTKCEGNRSAMCLDVLPFNMQIGQLGHELAHIAEYIETSVWGMIAIGVGFVLKITKRHLEKGTDLATIKHGLGHQILEFAEFMLHLQKEYPQEEYFQDYHKYYMTPGEVREKLRRLKLYENSQLSAER